jgi:hypothetical protein
MRIVLISPKGPLYRHRGGIFKRSLRYMPLTLTTLAALVPVAAGRLRARYDQRPGLSLAGLPFPRRDLRAMTRGECRHRPQP